MPVMDGCEAARRIRQSECERGLARTPLIALTANVMLDQKRTYAEIGFDAVVAKPIVLAELAQAMFHLLGDTEAEAEELQQRASA
jgi:CheY-like chemotaxis protein